LKISAFFSPSAHVIALALGLCVEFVATSVGAEPTRALALRTVISNQLDCSTPSLGFVPSNNHLALAKRVDSLVADAIEDGGHELVLPGTHAETDASKKPCESEQELLNRAKQGWVIRPQLIVQGDELMLRLVAATPSSRVLRVLTQSVTDQDVNVRAVVMVSELMASNPLTTRDGEDSAAHPTPTQKPVSGPKALPSHSAGRAVLSFTSAVLGGAVGYSLQRAGGSDDPRLTYPLIALGTGVGLGAAMIVADEWDVSVGEAWYVSAGMIWPATSGLLLARAYQVSPSTDRYVYGLGGALGGIALASIATSMSDVNEGDAGIAHSGGAMGLLLGGLVDMTVSGDTDHLPWHGMGYGSGLGVVLGGAVATQLNLSSSRVVFVDMAAGLGALAGAAIASPVLFGDGELISVKRQRLWLGSVGVGTLAGGALGWYLTRSWTNQEHVGSGISSIMPYATVTPVTTPEGFMTKQSQLNAGIQGTF
jgi:hypothetical protein